MFQLPSYFNELQLIMSPEQTSYLARMEESFYQIGFDEHVDEIINLFYDQTNIEVAVLCDSIFSTYRIAVNRVCSEQGVELSDPWETPINVLADISYSLMLLGTQPLDVILEGFMPVDGDENIEYFCDVLGYVMERSAAEVMTYINSVNSGVIDILQRQEVDQVEALRPHPTEVVVRFKKFYAEGSVKDSFVVEYVRQTNNLGYDVNSVYEVLFDLFDEKSKDIQSFVDELILLIAGSSSFIAEEISNFISEVIETTYDNIHDIQTAYKYVNRRPLYG